MNWLPSIFRRRTLYNDLAEEMRLHLEERTEQLMREGMSRKEAEQAARRAFGNMTRFWKNAAAKSGNGQRSNPSGPMYVMRCASSRILRAFPITVILSLTLGLGANTTIFTFVNALLLRPPAVADGGRLVEVMEHNAKASGIEAYMPFSYPGYARSSRPQPHSVRLCGV